MKEPFFAFSLFLLSFPLPSKNNCPVVVACLASSQDNKISFPHDHPTMANSSPPSTSLSPTGLQDNESIFVALSGYMTPTCLHIHEAQTHLFGFRVMTK